MRRLWSESSLNENRGRKKTIQTHSRPNDEKVSREEFRQRKIGGGDVVKKNKKKKEEKKERKRTE